MTTRYRLSPDAFRGLIRISIHVEENFGSEVADRVVDQIQDALELLAANPEAGHRRKDLTQDDGIRFWPVGPTLIAYRDGASEIEVVFIERADLDWDGLLGRIAE